MKNPAEAGLWYGSAMSREMLATSIAVFLAAIIRPVLTRWQDRLIDRIRREMPYSRLKRFLLWPNYVPRPNSPRIALEGELLPRADAQAPRRPPPSTGRASRRRS